MNKKAFTLVELLVVISIIAMLMAFLVPSLSRARGFAKQITCLSNLHQMVIAAEVYCNNNDGYYPIAYASKFSPSLSISYAWDFTTVKDWNTLELKVTPGLLWGGETIEKIHQCPSLKGGHNWLNDPYTGYNYNTSYIGHGSLEQIRTPIRVSKINSPANCAIFGDGAFGTGANKFMRAPWPSPGDDGSMAWAGAQAYRHLGKTSVAYCDGSARATDKLYKETEHSDRLPEGAGFLSADNSAYDLK